jgi:hypothetical protein
MPLKEMNTAYNRPVASAPDTQVETVAERDQEQIPRQSTWARRIGITIYALFSFEIGFLLIRLAWGEAWTQNSFFASYPEIRAWLDEGFVRGGATGLGLICIWNALSAFGWTGRNRS